MARIFTHGFHSLLSALQNGLRNVITWRNLFSKDEMGNSILGVDNNNNSFQLIYFVFLFFIYLMHFIYVMTELPFKIIIEEQFNELCHHSVKKY